MSLKISLDLLAPGLRSFWLSVPRHAKDPSQGWARVKVAELSKKKWDLLWGAVLEAQSSLQEAATKGASVAELVTLREAARETGLAVLRACVIDHNASDFTAECPVMEPTDPDYALTLAALVESGFSSERAQEGLATGLLPIPFGKTNGGLAEETLQLYERLAPDRAFVLNLTTMIARAQAGDVLTAGDIWRSEGVSEDKIPAPFAKPKEPTT